MHSTKLSEGDSEMKANRWFAAPVLVAVVALAAGACTTKPGGGGGTSGPVIEPGYTAASVAAAVRYRAQSSGKEIHIGAGDVAPGARTETEYAWADGAHQVIFRFDSVENKVVQEISGPGGGSATSEYAFGAPNADPGCDAAARDVLDILVRDSNTGGGLAFENVVLESTSLGDLGTVDVAGSPGFQNWTVSEFDFGSDFVLSGDLVVEGMSGSAEALKLQLSIGCTTP
jgi:hypothetical protein